MSQDFATISAAVPGGDTGTTQRNKLTDWQAALLSMHSGSSRPSYAQAGTMWRKTSVTPWIVYMYDGASDVPLWSVNPTTHLIAEVYSPAATTAIPGLMSAADKSKLDGIATGATANDTNANLRARGSHTGAQPQSTITNLVTDLSTMQADIDTREVKGKWRDVTADVDGHIFTLGEAGVLWRMTGDDTQFSLPSNDSQAHPIGAWCGVMNDSSGFIRVVAGSGATLVAPHGEYILVGCTVQPQKIGTNRWQVQGALQATAF